MGSQPPDPSTTRWYRAPDDRMWWWDGSEWVLWNRALGHPPLPKDQRRKGVPRYQQVLAVLAFVWGLFLLFWLVYEAGRP